MVKAKILSMGLLVRSDEQVLDHADLRLGFPAISSPRAAAWPPDLRNLRFQGGCQGAISSAFASLSSRRHRRADHR
jgi:hypothetical protein